MGTINSHLNLLALCMDTYSGNLTLYSIPLLLAIYVSYLDPHVSTFSPIALIPNIKSAPSSSSTITDWHI